LEESWTLAQWPKPYGEETKKALKKMIEACEYVVKLLPAFDIEGELILPAYLRKNLQGATAQLDFKCHSWRFSVGKGKPERNQFAIVIDSMTVVRAPLNASPNKLKSTFTTKKVSPVKKARLNNGAATTTSEQEGSPAASTGTQEGDQE
jgi:hypothetical protein